MATAAALTACCHGSWARSRSACLSRAESSPPRVGGTCRGFRVSARRSRRTSLADAKSPYLRSAAEQPVAWQQWGPDAFALARELDRPIWLDIGAIWCHWCHGSDPTPRAYVCVGETCVPPTTEPAQVAELVRDYGRIGER